MRQAIADRKGYLPQLSIEERDRRWRAVREEMLLRDLGCLLVFGSDRLAGIGEANFRYLTHVGTQRFGGICVFPLEGNPTAFIVGLNPRAYEHPFPLHEAYQKWLTPGKDIRVYPGMAQVAEALKEMGYGKSAIGLVDSASEPSGRTITYGDYNTLAAGLPGAKLEDATAILERVRMIKSPEEIVFLQRAAEIARLKIEALTEACHTGARECEVYARMVETDIASGGDPYIFNFMASGSVTERRRQHLLHGKMTPLAPTTRKLRRGDLIIAEFHTGYAGYLAATEKTLFIGEPPSQLRRVHDVAEKALKSGMAKMRPGATIMEVWQAMYHPVREAAMDYLELGIHGHGLRSPEFPSIAGEPKSPLGRCTGDMELKENMVFGTMVDVYDPDWRDDVGVMLGNTVWVTGDGARDLVGAPLELTCK